LESVRQPNSGPVGNLLHGLRPNPLDARELAAELLRDHFTATAALIALMLKHLPDEGLTRTLDAARNGTGKGELRTRVGSNEAELVLVPVDGSEPLARTK